MSRKLNIDDYVVCGIYYLWLGDEIVYIGQSTNILGRIFNHASEKEFDGFTYQQCSVEELDDLEAVEIVKHYPKYNTILHSNNIYCSLTKLKSILGKGAVQIKKAIKRANIEVIQFKTIKIIETKHIQAIRNEL